MQYQPQQQYQYSPLPYPQQQRPQQGYPIQQYPPQAYPVQRYTQPRMMPEQYRQYEYKRKLRRTVNSLGALLLIFIGLESTIVYIAEKILEATGMESELLEMGMLYFLETGMISLLIFFFSGLIYCLIKRLRFADIFPFEKIKGSYLAQLCVIGLSFSLMSNYVVDLINNTFGLFGLENSGGSIDAGSSPNVLLYFLTVAILPAFAEEFTFRGIIMGSLRPYSEGLAILVSSATFALMHGNFVQLPFTFCCGLVFAYIDIKCNSLLPSIIIHFLNNGLSVLFDVLTSYQILDEYWANFGYGVIFVITGILSFIFIKRIISRDDGSLFKLRSGDNVLTFKRKVRTAASSPTLIIFAVVMFINCFLTLFYDALTQLLSELPS